MAVTTVGGQVDEALRLRLRQAAESIGQSPEWPIRQGLAAILQRIGRGKDVAGLTEPDYPMADGPRPFMAFAQALRPQSGTRAAITAAYRRPEPECLPPLLAAAAQLPPEQARAEAVATRLVTALRAHKRRGGVEGLMQEFSLSSQEGVALMCLAEALLRIPDRPTRDALIRDKVARGDWHAHLGHSPSLFVNAAAWGLMISGKLVATQSEGGLARALTRLIGRGGEPLIRAGVDLAMRLMGEQFVCGQTIAEALSNARRLEARGFRYSFDMLGEAALTADDAARYQRAYEQAIDAIGQAAAGRGVQDGPGISIKLSALHPRYGRAQADRVMGELRPRLRALAARARGFDIGLNIDAEEADRLDLSLDLLEALCDDPALAGWNGIGFVVQAYQKRASFVIDDVIGLARRTQRRIMLRLVKGAYWDAEIKRAHVDGLEDFPVFTRKVHTDVSYLACARKLLAARDAVFPQFATHNARTLAAVMTMAGEEFRPGDYEFQCLHGMGEPLYEEVVGPDKLNRPCRIYAPVGTHETLLAYLVRRLLENGANTSFVNRIADASVPVADLIADPVVVAQSIAPLGTPHPRIPLPRDIYGPARRNSAGLDFSDEQRLTELSGALQAVVDVAWRAAPILADGIGDGEGVPVRNPADTRDLVGRVVEATDAQIDAALAFAAHDGAAWSAMAAADRAACLLRAADRLEADAPVLMALICREAGRTLPNTMGEVREAADFLRYYAAQARELSAESRPLGPVVAISPWNFPLAIFTGQIAAALAAGNPVLAKPAEQTPLVAARAVSLLHAAGVPRPALQLLPGDGRVGARLVSDTRVRGVVFTGSTEVSRLIARTLARRLNPDGAPVPFVAETGGQNAMVVDSSALPEQVVADAITSAFDSAGQRCSALRLLCVQEDAADRMIAMLLGALAELTVGLPDRLSTDVGPVISAEAAERIEAHVAAMRDRGRRIHRLPLGPDCSNGCFVAPTVIEIDRISELTEEVFGPVLHVLRYRREDIDGVIDAVNATGYGLTFGVHSRIDEFIARVTSRIAAGNIYVNRNMIGAVVGVQPFGGHGLSGTGPKAGGPLALRRLLAVTPAMRVQPGWETELVGAVGERNTYKLEPRRRVLCVAATAAGLEAQMRVVAGAASVPVVLDRSGASLLGTAKPQAAQSASTGAFDAVLHEGDSASLLALLDTLAHRDGPLVGVQTAPPSGPFAYDPVWLLRERAVSVNTAAAGGNASLMTIG